MWKEYYTIVTNPILNIKEEIAIVWKGQYVMQHYVQLQALSIQL